MALLARRARLPAKKASRFLLFRAFFFFTLYFFLCFEVAPMNAKALRRGKAALTPQNNIQCTDVSESQMGK